MEKPLRMRMQDEHQVNVDSRERYKLYEDLRKKNGEESKGTSFNASFGWFPR